ncbi:MAG: serine hydrolase domain-containing protein [Cytophagales bacterium]
MKRILKIFIIALTICQVSYGQENADKIDSLLTVFYDKKEFNGTVLVAENRRQVYHGAYGHSDFDTKEKLDTNSIFNIASATKPLTAMAILILHDRDELNIDDDVTKYLTELPYEGITLRHMLNHTSGLPDFSNEFDQFKDLIDTSKAFANEDLLALLEEHAPPLNFEPGEKYSYSNTGYNLLTMVVVNVTGKPFEEFLQTEIFDPLEMKHSFSGATFTNDKETTKGYRYRDGAYIRDSLGVYIASLRGSSFEFSTQGSGDIRSTTGDLFKFDQALRNGELVKLETLEQAYTKATLNDSTEIPYGFGWRIYEDSTKKSVYHGGSAIGYRSLFRRGIRTDNNTIIILSNATNANSFAILNGINAILNE